MEVIAVLPAWVIARRMSTILPNANPILTIVGYSVVLQIAQTVNIFRHASFHSTLTITLVVYNAAQTGSTPQAAVMLTPPPQVAHLAAHAH
jgi:hypothetical protein